MFTILYDSVKSKRAYFVKWLKYVCLFVHTLEDNVTKTVWLPTFFKISSFPQNKAHDTELKQHDGE